ncbi:hypothetical protein HN51_063899 [Arachis hypogaea]|uniref:Pectinesterase inhibitor domain-containing protein n=1 Tax=Arachis hypogaea TaxID=3818 RepID=A0A445AWD8_ARAHY|nr:cell wall / vacuolar inhibitor of fructosidase 1-like [Arachis ipaensis]XP_025628837.1 cell wall / vacuolar inhibitor of fructosidase 1-like [Arachis hypogaea]RYR30731.1 hypothetical protein Ahy_B01g055500 [Arachis hypogaea]
MKQQYYLSSLNIFLCTIIVVVASMSHSDDDKPKVIVQACSNTPNPDQCFHYIKADPRSNTVKDVQDVGILMARILQLKAKLARDKIYRMMSAAERPDLKVHKLKACLGSYNNILNVDVEVAIDAFKDGNPRMAEVGADTASHGVSDCEESFNGESPITNFNTLI